MNIEDAAVVKAMLDALPEEEKQKLLHDAIHNHLMRETIEVPKPDGWGKMKISRLQHTFNNAVSNMAREIVCEELKKPENEQVIRAAVQKSIELMLESDEFEHEVVDAFGRGFGQALGRLYRRHSED